MERKCGFVTLAGRPNVGKSTLMNAILKEPLAIVSPKPQTTWNVIRGILTVDSGQIIFIDTPGLHQARDGLGEHMIAATRRALSGGDLTYWMVDCRDKPDVTGGLLQKLLPVSSPVFLLINKIDLVPHPRLLPLIDYFSRLDRFKEIIPLSAREGENVERLLLLTWEYLPAGALLFPPDQLSDQPEKELIKEFIREQVFLYTHQEIPYSTAVKVEEIRTGERGSKLFISATIHAERDSQKGMLVGKKGEMIKKIGRAARRRIENLLGKQIYLALQVKVRKKWRRDSSSLREFGFRT
jgi:GTP-binding protein Era